MSLTQKEFSAGLAPHCLLASEYVTVAEAMAHCMTSGGLPWPEIVVSGRALRDAILRPAPPAIAVVDFDLPELGALPGVARLCADAGRTRIIVLTEGNLRYTAARLMAVGCAGVVPRDAPAERLCAAFTLVSAGESYVPRDAMPALLQAGRLRDGTALTEKEAEVLRGLCEGMTNNAIAARTMLPVMTVQSVVRNICQRLGASNRTQAALIALTAGLV